MSEIQMSGFVLLLTAISIVILAIYIERKKHYSLFAGWDASRISNHDDCGRMMCKGLKSFALVMGLGGGFLILTQIGGDLLVLAITLLSLGPLIHYIFKARKLYWN